MPVRVAQALQQARETGQRLDQIAVAALEQRPPLGRDRLGVLEVLLEQDSCVAGVDSVYVRHGKPSFVVATSAPLRRGPLENRMVRDDREEGADDEAGS